MVASPWFIKICIVAQDKNLAKVFGNKTFNDGLAFDNAKASLTMIPEGNIKIMTNS